MRRARISSNAVVGEGPINPEAIQDRLVDPGHVHHDHGGHEHGHDWDDWLKADREIKSQGLKRRRGRSESWRLWKV